MLTYVIKMQMISKRTLKSIRFNLCFTNHLLMIMITSSAAGLLNNSKLRI